MVRRTKETHTTNRTIRIRDDDWADLGALYGERGRSAVLKDWIAFHLRRDGAKQPPRPDQDVIDQIIAERE